MPLLQVVNSTKFEIGRFGGSFIDLYKVPKELNNGPGKYLPRNVNPATPSGAVSVGMGTNICVSGFKQDPSRRSFFSIDTSGLNVPVETCTTPEGRQRFFDQFRSPIPYDDAFLNRDPNSDYINGQDISQSRFAGETYGYTPPPGSEGELKVVSAISFSLTAYEYEDESFTPYYGNTLRIFWSRGMGQDGTCPSSEIFRPVIATDGRNEESINLVGGFRKRLSNPLWWLSGNRYYIEIRHGLGTKDYVSSVSDGGHFEQIAKENSLILSRHIEQKTNILETSKQYRPDESVFELLKGRINVTIMADPCNISSQTDPSLY